MTPYPTATFGPPVKGGVYHYHYNHLGSVQVVTDANGAAVELIRYEPYGEVRGHYDSSGTLEADNTCADDQYCHEFTGYDTEPISGLQYAGARFYDPELGMFLTHNPAGQTANPYAYAGWDPANNVDVNGEFWFEVFVILAFVATAVDVGIKTGDVGAALKAGISSVPWTIAGAQVGGAMLGTVTSAASTAFGPTVGQAVAYAAVGASGGYGVYQAASHGYYASAGLGAVLTAFSLEQLYANRALIGAQPAEPGGGQGQSGQRFISDEERSAWEQSELEPAQATQSQNTRAEAVYGESASVRPQPNDPASATDLQRAREWIADVSDRNPNVRLARPTGDTPSEIAAWNDAVRASQAPTRSPLDVRHFFMRQAGQGMQQPWWAQGQTAYQTFGPFAVPSGGAIPPGNRAYIDFYRGIR